MNQRAWASNENVCIHSCMTDVGVLLMSAFCGCARVCVCFCRPTGKYAVWYHGPHVRVPLALLSAKGICHEPVSWEQPVLSFPLSREGDCFCCSAAFITAILRFPPFPHDSAGQKTPRKTSPSDTEFPSSTPSSTSCSTTPRSMLYTWPHLLAPTRTSPSECAPLESRVTWRSQWPGDVCQLRWFPIALCRVRCYTLLLCGALRCADVRWSVVVSSGSKICCTFVAQR